MVIVSMFQLFQALPVILTSDLPPCILHVRTVSLHQGKACMPVGHNGLQ